MGLETATYIEDLVGSNPLGTDSKAQGDNHLRLIKNVLKNQFPSLGSTAVTATAAELNDLIDSFRGVPTGLISLWSGTILTVPAGWALCDGVGGTPNLVNRFIIGTGTDAGGDVDVGDTGGFTDQAGTTVSSTVLTLAQIPAHTHPFTASIGNIQNGSDGSGERVGPVATASNTGSAGSNQGHDHTAPSVAGANMPPFFALAYIIKL
jgi:microcystin-dependent protein